MMHQIQKKISRKTQLKQWLRDQFALSFIDIKAIKNDASFRQYYRCTINGSSYIVMDAPPDKENICSFIKITNILSKANILVPELIAYNIEQGFMVLSDFGDRWFLDVLKTSTSAQITTGYQQAIDTLIQIQGISFTDLSLEQLPVFDANHIRLELSYFSEWFIGKLLNLSLNQAQLEIINKASNSLIQSAMNETQVMIHRDYHSRNLMVLPNQTLGIIDYQDAMIGPLSYDLASLLKDCYIVWPKVQLDEWLAYYYNHMNAVTQVIQLSFLDFKKSFEFMALQRHLKVLGVFSRLNIRDNKPQYIKDIPRIIQYVLSVTGEYPELLDFNRLFLQDIIPAFEHDHSLLQDIACVQ